MAAEKKKGIIKFEEADHDNGDDKVITFFSPIDNSCVDYIGESGNMELYFD